MNLNSNPPIKQRTHLRSTTSKQLCPAMIKRGVVYSRTGSKNRHTQIDLGSTQRTSRSIDGVHGPWRKSKRKSFMKQRLASRLQQRQHPKKMGLQINPNNGQKQIFVPTHNRSR
ncbi:hypothetical protein ACLOJK_019654 [Asimina triloba]